MHNVRIHNEKEYQHKADFDPGLILELLIDESYTLGFIDHLTITPVIIYTI